MTSPRVAGLGYCDWAVVFESAVEHDHFVAVVDVHSSMAEVSTKQTLQLINQFLYSLYSRNTYLIYRNYFDKLIFCVTLYEPFSAHLNRGETANLNHTQAYCARPVYQNICYCLSFSSFAEMFQVSWKRVVYVYQNKFVYYN